MVIALKPKSIITFDRSQQAVFDDQSRVIVVNFHRQKGKDFVAAGKAVDEAIRLGDPWYLISLTQRQADETFLKAKKFAQMYKKLLRLKGELQFNEIEFAVYDKELNKTLTWTKREIIFPNGGRVVSLPGRDPDTLAGLTGNIILTEFGLFPNGGYEHWAVLFPIITRGRYKVLVISTPRGKNTKFYELTTNTEDYSYHFCDIYKSVFEEGYQLYDKKGKPFPMATRAEQEAAITAYRKLYGDESKWPREFECLFTGDLMALISFAQLQAAGNLGRGLPFDWLRIDGDNANAWSKALLSRIDPKAGRLEIGWDVARTSDLASMWVNQSTPGRAKNLRLLTLMHKTSFALQRQVIFDVMDFNSATVGCGDATGLGMDSNETLSTKYSKHRWLSFNFTAAGKSELASLGISAYDSVSQAIPPMDSAAAFVASDIAAVQADRSSDHLHLDEGDNPLLPESHCDIAYSNFLALKAGSLNPQVGGLVTW